MRFKIREFLLSGIICVLMSGYGNLLFGAEDVKLPNFAGSFYPDDPQELSKMIDGFLEKANPPAVEGKIFALIVPHAGYGFSGPTAAYGFKLIKGKPYKTVIVLAPSHRYAFMGASVYPKGAFRTPLGDLQIDAGFTQKLLTKDKDSDIVFDPAAFKEEHSLEVELPFLQKVLSNGWKLVPIVLGDCTLKSCEHLAETLKSAIGNRTDVLVVASTDMYHGYDYDECEATDAKTLDVMKKMDAEGLYYGVRDNSLQLCGGFGVVTTLMLSKKLGHNILKVLNHTNSCVATGKMQKGIWTVGYGASAIDNNTKEAVVQGKKEEAMLDKQERKKLLELARNSIETYLKTNKKLEVSETDPLLLKDMGAFVTLREHDNLRGCIGNLTGSQPLYLTIRDMAVEAATGDSRFPQVNPSELKDIEIEISVLSPMQKVNSADDVEIGKHGVMVRRGYRSGVFLPQVAAETGWSKEEFLSQLCSQKAGLPADAWKDKSTDIYVFTAEVFSEGNY
ncbi:MAG: AmmeMemoRadiSam system protein B [Candidatus Omnitrophica bacterium]|nr:AmmeMemoRadiSam system protein B [Candidatus Omnitrophota bacterium]